MSRSIKSTNSHYFSIQTITNHSQYCYCFWMIGSGATLVMHCCFGREHYLEPYAINAHPEILALTAEDYFNIIISTLTLYQ